MEDDLRPATEQFDESKGEQTIQFDKDISSHRFSNAVLPYTLGYVSNTHGVVDVGYTKNTITVAPLAE